MAFTIMFGYAGIPVYKMICTEDGHMEVSLSHDDAGCHHEQKAKSCCAPKQAKPQPVEPKGCCDYNNSFLHLEEISPVTHPQTSTGHFLSVVAVLFTPFTIEELLAISYDKAIVHAPPLMPHKQSQQSLTQVFRI
jgi:hypothetical protein